MAKQFEYEQQLQHLKIPVEEIKNVLDNKPVQYAYIIHDKDVNDDGSPKEPHIHVMCKLLNSDMLPKDLCKWFKDEPQYINIKKSRWGNKLSYLVHRTKESADKYQYDPLEVVANFDYVNTLEIVAKQVEVSNSIESIVEQIQCGKIREYNLTEYIDAHIYSRYKTKIINALEWYRRKVMTDKNRNINVILLTGSTGTGKTTYAKQYCENLKKTYCVSSSSNDPFQDYKGEDVMILDDVRDSTFKYSDLLKILDNHTSSTVASRYSNKAFIGDTIILTSAVGIRRWYEGKTDEDKHQLYRRIPQWLVLTEDRINIYQYDTVKRDYKFVASAPNTVRMKFKDARKSMVDTLTGFGIELSDDVRNKLLEPNENDDRTLGDIYNDPNLPF